MWVSLPRNRYFLLYRYGNMDVINVMIADYLCLMEIIR